MANPVKALDGLIRLARNGVDAARRNVTAVEDQITAIEADDARLVAEVAAEKAAAGNDPAMIAGWVAYADRVDRRRAEIARHLTLLRKARERALEDLAEAFRTVKRYEIARDNRLARAAHEADLRETDRMDEIGMAGFRRKAAEEGE